MLVNKHFEKNKVRITSILTFLLVEFLTEKEGFEPSRRLPDLLP